MITREHTKLADQVWIALALLLRDNPEAEGFSVSKIKERVRQEFGVVAPGIETHIRQHCLADKEPTPGRYRMLVKAAKDKYRLFREGDSYHSDREGAKTTPNREDIPEPYQSLLTWYAEQYSPQIKIFGPEDLALLMKIKPVASGYTDIAANHHRHLADAYFEHHVVKRTQ